MGDDKFKLAQRDDKSEELNYKMHLLVNESRNGSEASATGKYPRSAIGYHVGGSVDIGESPESNNLEPGVITVGISCNMCGLGTTKMCNMGHFGKGGRCLQLVNAYT